MTDADRPMTWQEAVARLTRDRALAIAAVQHLKATASPQAIAQGAALYASAKAEYDAVLAGLAVALAQRHATANLRDLQARLTQGLLALDALRARAAAAPPPPGQKGAGQKSLIVDLANALTAAHVVKLIETIWLRIRDDNVLTRKTIETQLRAAAWPDFAAIDPAA